MLWLKDSALAVVTVLSFLALSFGLGAAAFISDAFSQGIKAGVGVTAFAFLFGILGAGGFGWACKTWWDLHWLRLYGVAAKGVVTRIKQASGQQPLSDFYVNYGFTDREGRDHRGRVTIPGRAGASWSEGRAVNVLYDPRRPKRNISMERWLKVAD